MLGRTRVNKPPATSRSRAERLVRRGQRRRIYVAGVVSVVLSITGLVVSQGSAIAAAPPPAGGYFQISAPGSTFPTEAQCAAQVHMSPWEPRSENNTANHTAPTNPAALANFSQWSSAWNSTYKPRIDGNFQGTTDEIIQWAACKWGWSDEVIRAEAVVESTWRQSTAGDSGHSFGLLQIKYDFHPAGPAKGAVGSSWPNSQNSTAYAVDQQVAEMRGCYDGMSTYLGNTTGDVWGCLQSWFSGSWTPGGGAYANQVKGYMTSRPWASWADQSGSTTPPTTVGNPVTTTHTVPVTTSPTTKKPPVTTTTLPSPPKPVTVYACLNSAGKVEAPKVGVIPQVCAHPWDRRVKWAGKI